MVLVSYREGIIQGVNFEYSKIFRTANWQSSIEIQWFEHGNIRLPFDQPGLEEEFQRVGR